MSISELLLFVLSYMNLCFITNSLYLFGLSFIKNLRSQYTSSSTFYSSTIYTFSAYYLEYSVDMINIMLEHGKLFAQFYHSNDKSYE